MTATRPAFIFDLDGTLIDSAPDIHGAVNRILATEGLPPLPLERIQSFVGNGATVLVSRCLAAHGLPQDGDRIANLAKRLEADYVGAVHLTTLYPGVKNALEQLVKAHFSLGVCTNKPIAPTQAVLRHFGLFDVFSVITGGDTLDQRKPDPRPLLWTQSRLGGGPVIFVGDSEVDAATAKAADLPFWLHSGGYRTKSVQDFDADWIFDDYVAFAERIFALV